MYNICTFEGWMDGTLCNTRSPAVVKTLCLHVTIIILITMYLYLTSTTTNPFCYYFFKQKKYIYVKVFFFIYLCFQTCLVRCAAVVCTFFFYDPSHTLNASTLHACVHKQTNKRKKW